MMRRTCLLAAPPASGFMQRWIKSVENVGGYYKPSEMTSKDIYNHKKTNVAFDPVANNEMFKSRTGPLRRKQSMKLDNYVNVDEAEKWMEVHHAAKLLGITEAELSTLTKETLEVRWAKVYKEQSFAHQQESIVAAEVLLEYLDSRLFVKKNRAYYKEYVENAKSSIDHDLQKRRDGYRQNIWLIAAFFMFGGCCMVAFAAVLNGRVDRGDAVAFGKSTAKYLNHAFNQPSNLEPAPDYGTRYLKTPSALELDEKTGDLAKRFVDPVIAAAMTQDEEYREQEDVLTIRLINQENERRAREARERELMESTIVVHRKEDYDANGVYKGLTSKSQQLSEEERRRLEEPFSVIQFSDFMTRAQTQFGGSKTQKFAASAATHARDQLGVDTRLRMINPVVDALVTDSSAMQSSPKKE